MNLYVSNLSYTLTDDELRAAFETFGVVSSARVVLDRETGRSRGFGFVEMPDNSQAIAAINGINGQEVGGRPVKVVEARPKEDRPGGFGGGPRNYGGGGGQRNFGGGGGGGGQRNFGGGGGGRDWGDDRGGGGGRGRGDRGDRGDRGWDRGRRGGGDDEGW